MTLSHEPGHDSQLVRYLLGLLPEEDSERLDELTVADDEFAWRLRVVEDDLIDAYVARTLAGEALERFESFYLSSERRRQKVEFARSFRGAVDRERNSVPSGASPSYRSMVPRSRTAWICAAAAALLLLVCGALYYDDMRAHGALNDARSASAALSNRARDLEQQLNDQRAANVRVADEPTNGRAPRTPAVQNAATLPSIALVLLPQTRAMGPMATLAVPREIDRVALELRLEPNDFLRYQVALRDPGANQITWRSDTLAARTADGVPTVSVVVPASLLKPQHYSLELDGLGATGGAEVIGSYIFRVVRR